MMDLGITSMWRWARHRLADPPMPNDIEEARQMRRIAEEELAHARSQRAEIERATSDLNAHQRGPDQFAELVDEAFKRRPRQ